MAQFGSTYPNFFGKIFQECPAVCKDVSVCSSGHAKTQQGGSSEAGVPLCLCPLWQPGLPILLTFAWPHRDPSPGPIPGHWPLTQLNYVCFFCKENHWFAWRGKNQWPLIAETRFSFVPSGNFIRLFPGPKKGFLSWRGFSTLPHASPQELQRNMDTVRGVVR